MGKITQNLPNRYEIPKLKRKRRRKDLDDLRSRILKTKRKSDKVEENQYEDQHNKPNPSKIVKKYTKPVYTGIFRNGTKSKNIRKEKYGNTVSKARLRGDALKLFDGESETICMSRSTVDDESTSQLPNNNKELVKNISRPTRHRKKSPVLGKKQRPNRTYYLGDVSQENKEVDNIVYDPIDIPEVVINYNSSTKRATKETQINKKKKETTDLPYNKNTSCSIDWQDHYIKICDKISKELKNVLDDTKDPLSEARKKLKELISTNTDNMQTAIHVIESSQNRDISCSSKDKGNTNKIISNYSIDNILSTVPDIQYSNASHLSQNNSKLPFKRRRSKRSSQFTILISPEEQPLLKFCETKTPASTVTQYQSNEEDIQNYINPEVLFEVSTTDATSVRDHLTLSTLHDIHEKQYYQTEKEYMRDQRYICPPTDIVNVSQNTRTQHTTRRHYQAEKKLKKRYMVTTPEEFSMQVNDKQNKDCDKYDALQKYPSKIDKSRSNNERKFCELDFVNMFQNLPTPSTVNRQFYRSRVPYIRSMKMNDPVRSEKSDADLINDSSKREDGYIRLQNCIQQAPFEILTAAATFIEHQHLSQAAAQTNDRTKNIFTDRCVPISSNSKESSSYCSSQLAGSSNFNVDPTKQRHKSTYNCKERNIFTNCSNGSHECNISQTHQNHAKTSRIAAASKCSYFPIHYRSVANNYVDHNIGHTHVLPLVSDHDPYTYSQQVDDHHMVCLQNFIQPVKYFALERGVDVHKMPIYVNNGACRCWNPVDCCTVAFYNKRDCVSTRVNLERCHDTTVNESV
ncbi:uncharacterized protein LOC105189427 [Harpegnathos saltator]|uniref:uncharacterized protein LOC105189427 n=1 Tax=Harpegnathos saltator TaxID=610380 RepID=UPI00058CFB7F|nr:uncharacterized protein LOC105189427 [Harpegnathos saltator]